MPGRFVYGYRHGAKFCISIGRQGFDGSRSFVNRERGRRQIHFCDTGNESPKTYAYIDYLDEKLESMTGRKIIRIKADFSREITIKQQKLIAVGELDETNKGAKKK